MSETPQISSLDLHRSERRFTDNFGRVVIAITTKLTDPLGEFDDVTFRKWSMYRDGNYIAVCPTESEILELERALGEWPDVQIIRHSILGLVSTPK